MFKNSESIKEMCESLNPENKRYVLAVAQALKFAQQSSKTASHLQRNSPKKAS